MIKKGKILAIVLAVIGILCTSVHADNKSDLLSKIASLEENLNTLKINSIKDLEAKAIELSKSFDDALTSSGYDVKAVSYLVSLGKINSNFKDDLTIEVNNLTKEILDKTLAELSSLNFIKNDIVLNYKTISDKEKESFLKNIESIESNYTNLSSYFPSKISNLNNKYLTNLANYKESVKNAYSANLPIIKNLNDFATKYDALYALNNEFQKNYSVFKNTYLSFAGELANFSKEKQKYYVNVLKKELEKIRDVNIEANKALENYRSDIDRLIDILLENFASSLKDNINESHGVIYSDGDINLIISRFNTIKNRYYDLNGKLKALEVVSNTGALEEVNFVSEKLSSINDKIVALIGTGSKINTLENLKIRLENEMIKFYNANYQDYRKDLLLKLKEKLSIVALETKNAIIAADNIDLRYSLLSDKISKSSDIDYINSEIEKFKKDSAKYGYLNNEVLSKKLRRIYNNLSIFATEKELGLPKYRDMNKTKCDKEFGVILSKLKQEYPNDYATKLNAALTKIDKLLLTKLRDKTRFALLCIKLNVLNHISDS